MLINLSIYLAFQFVYNTVKRFWSVIIIIVLLIIFIQKGWIYLIKSDSKHIYNKSVILCISQYYCF